MWMVVRMVVRLPGTTPWPQPWPRSTATENAQRVIDTALCKCTVALGVKVRHQVVEHLYRDIRSLRIYEGATEVQQLIIGKANC